MSDTPPDIAACKQADRGYNTMVLILYIVVAGIGASAHQMWRDEMQAWLIARDSATPWAIITNLRYDGHPALWYFLIWPITRVTWNPDAMKLASLGASIGGVALFLWHGPWSRLEKALWPFGFYILFEYGVKSRSYNLGVFLLMLFCALWPYRRTRILPIALVLGLMANVHIYFGILAGAGVLAILVDRCARDGWRGLNPTARDLLALGLVGGLTLFAAIVAAPPATGDFSAPSRINPASVLTAIGKIAIPASFLVDIGIPMSAAVLPYLAGIAIALAFLFACLSQARRALPALAFHLGALLALLAFFYLIYPADNQHAGMILLALIAGEWIRRGLQPNLPPGRARFFLGATLGCQVGIGLMAVGTHAFTAYSHGKHVAEYIRAQGWENEPLAGISGPLTTVCGYLEKHWCLYAERGRKSSYLIVSGTPGTLPTKPIPPEELARHAAAAASLGPAVLLVLSWPWPGYTEALAPLGFQKMREFTGATSENYILYRKAP